MGSRASRKLSVLSMLNLRQTGANGRPASVMQTLKDMGWIGIFIGVLAAVLLLGSVAAILV
ncbi:hypothetical protein [Allobaculum mucilyticum]|uniref:hypothetical protein n=1 Tax=Allobaculum mucilyticum TaxID=2834459 RepID=UPI001E41971F|nr:hypothetical protein [Allobaculum mucilyticum]UNT96217.1 hypothetical protein KWG62_00180 [Allobaculum mucilyticum]